MAFRTNPEFPIDIRLFYNIRGESSFPGDHSAASLGCVVAKSLKPFNVTPSSAVRTGVIPNLSTLDFRAVFAVTVRANPKSIVMRTFHIVLWTKFVIR